MSPAKLPAKTLNPRHHNGVYDPAAIEKKWQEHWENKDLYRSTEDASRAKYYVLDMFPYPSGTGLHVGHLLGYIASDIVARYKRMKGYSVLHPMGFDAFGLPAEQYAILTGQHPATTTQENLKQYKKQLRRLGLSYDWKREVNTAEPSYYRWTQWIFKQLFHSWYNKKTHKAEPVQTLTDALSHAGNTDLPAACDKDTPSCTAAQWQAMSEKERQAFLRHYRLTYLSEMDVNWCPALGTVLSNDEVKDGYSERGGHPVVQKKMSQWVMRITAYAERLLQGLDNIDWPASIKDMQRHWIGRSEGVELCFSVKHHSLKIPVFTTRPDTLYGVTFLCLAPESPWVAELTTPPCKTSVNAFVARTRQRSERTRVIDIAHAQGVPLGSYAIHPLTGEDIPLWVADYVLEGYGTGAVMGVPAHDARDHIFASTYQLPIRKVVEGGQEEETAYETRKGALIHSDRFTGMEVEEAIVAITAHLEQQGLGKAVVNYRLRDAVFGRQRYWGEPFPVYFKDELPYTLEDDALPLLLPSVDAYLPTASGEPPLARAQRWQSKDGYALEKTTMPGWAGSSWYFFRYMDPQNEKAFCAPEKQAYWKNVDLYMGGAEHAVGHLLYARFWTFFLRDRGYVDTEEFADKLVNQGMIQGKSNFVYRVKGKNQYVSLGLKDQYDTTPLHVDIAIVQDGVLDLKAFMRFRQDAKEATFVLEKGQYFCGTEVEKMSKSRFNVISPETVIATYGADTLRLYEMFLGPLEQNKPWDMHGIDGASRFLKKLWKLFHAQGVFAVSEQTPTQEEHKVLHQMLQKVTQATETLSFNTAVSAFMIAVNALTRLRCHKRSILEALLRALAPYVPHMAEELWHAMGHKTSITTAPFPAYEAAYLQEDTCTYPVTINGKLRTKVTLPVTLSTADVEEQVLSHVIVQKWTHGKAPRRVIVVPQRIVNIVM